MKKFFRTALVLPLVLFAVSCSESNDDGGNDKPVKLSPDTKLEQQVYADDQQAPAPIKFTATAPWKATVAEVPTKAEAGRLDWLTLSAYEGGAGEVSLTMTLSPNYTGTDRKAEIRIACGGTTITITVEQKGTTESGEVPEDPENPEPGKPTPANYALVESIEVNFFAGCKDKYNSETNHYVFRYDDQNRIAEYEVAQYDYYNGTGKPELNYKYTTRLDYTIQGEIRLTEKTTYNGSEEMSETETYRVRLDDQGRATQIEADGGGKEGITYYTYNNEGLLSRFSWYEYSTSSELSYEDMTYQNGVFSKALIHEPDHNDREIIFPADAFSDRPNNRLNIDPNWLLFTDPDEAKYMLPMLRLAGKSCDRLTLWVPNNYEDDVVMADSGWPEPNVTIHRSNDYYNHETDSRLQYTFNDDGTIATIIKPIVCIQMRHEYDVVSGNELYDPENPGAGYKYTIRNETRREIGRTQDKHEWKFIYRK